MSHPSLIATAAELTTWRARPPLRPSSVRGCPDGDGGAVLVLPGLLGSDRQTRLFRSCLQMLGYTPLGWEMGVNLGPSPGVLELLADRVSKLAATHGRLRLVGFGMGGMLARWAAQARSATVREVITVNTPFRESVHTAFRNVSPMVRSLRGLDLNGLSVLVRQPPVCAWAALYSKQDGIVSWNCCMEPAASHLCFEVTAKHMSCMRNENVFRQVADCLIF